MNLRKRWISVLVVILVLAAMIAGITLLTPVSDGMNLLDWHKETIHLWYTDDSLTDYLNNKALDFYNATDVRVETKLVSGLEYLEAINQASLSDEETTPDVYILSNDSLEKAYLAGLATPINNAKTLEDSTLFSQAARNAVSYHGNYVGYPLYFETSALLYNKTYLNQIAAEAGLENADSLIPSSIADILTIADQYSTPENVEYFFRWDVSDIFYNYFFIGNYISVGGDAGDDKSHIDIYNTQSIASLKVYQEMNQFFSIDTKESSYDSVIQEFLDGKTIYTIATSDCLKRLEEASGKGEFDYEYGIAKLPDINQDMITKGMSVTNALVINGYSGQKDIANQFVEFLSEQGSEELYEMTGKLPARLQTSYEDDRQLAFVQNYIDSVPIPKLTETSNFWVELEICFAKVWDGADANTELRSLSEQIKTQAAGETYTEEVLEDPQVELLPDTGYEESSDSE